MKGRRDVNARSAASENRRYVAGVHPVREHLRSDSKAIVQIWIAREAEARHRRVAEDARAAAVPVSYLPSRDLARMCGHAAHQGLVAALREFDYASLSDLVGRRPPLLVAADGVEDPRNLGALIRGVAAAGAGGVLIPQDRAAPVTTAVEKAAAGVTAWFPVCRVVNLVRALTQLKQEGEYWVVGLAQDGESDIFGAEVPMPAVLVVGGETGLRDLVRRTCDVTVRIPMAAGVESLNVAVAAAVATFEVRRRHIDRYGGGW